MSIRPVVVVGAGPVGLAAAAHLHRRNQAFVLLEAGDTAAHSVRSWGHVRLFSPWKFLVDPVATELLQSHGWQPPPPDHHPTGHALVTAYLDPLAEALSEWVRLEHRVLAITRRGHDRMKDGARTDAPFCVVVQTPAGRRRILARAVIDASGTWKQPNPMGAGGVQAAGEQSVAGFVHYGIPDPSQVEGLGGQRVLVVGSGHSAVHSLLALADLEGTQVAWGIRTTDPSALWGGGQDDELPARGALGTRIHAAVQSGRVVLVPGLSIGSVERNADGIEVVDTDGVPRCNVDHIIVATGR